MPSLSLTVVPGKALRDGRNKVRIAVAHNGQTRYLLTDVTIDKPTEFKHGMVVRRPDAAYLNTRLRTLLNQVQRIIDGLEYAGGLTCAELVRAVKDTRMSRSHTLRSVFEQMLEVADIKATTRQIYQTKFNALARVIPPGTLVKNVTPVMVQRFIKVRSSQVSQATVQTQLTLLAQILHFSQRNGYTEFRTLPTAGLCRSVVAVRQNWLTPAEVRRVRDTPCPRLLLQKFRDVFMLSYYLGGINLIDLVKIDFNACQGTLRYVRTKTERKPKVNPWVEFDIPAEALPIIARYKGADGRLRLFGSAPELQCHSLGHAARVFREAAGLPSLTFYSARKSFAQHAFALGQSESVIDYVLGHSLGGGRKTSLYAYIKVTPAMATACVRKVLDFLASDRNF